MEGPETTGGRPGGIGIETDRICVESFHFGDEIQTLMTVVPPPESGGSSFTALLELPPTQAMELLHSPESAEAPAVISGAIQVDQHQKTYLLHNFNCSSPPTFQSKSNLIDSAARLSILADGTGFGEESTETMSSVPLNAGKVKNEPDTDSNQNSSAPLISYPTVHNKNQKSVKRKEREKRVKESNKKSKSSGNESSGDAEKLPYVHVRARRGQATNSHSLAERARREKINARMKLLQQLVPGCNKISGTALVLDEIINHVQSLQHQVELLSMRLSAVDPRVDFNLHSLFAAESGSLMDSNFPGMFAPVIWSEVQLIGNRQQDQHSWQFDVYPQQPVWGREEENHNFLTTENSLLSYDSSPNSVSLHANQLKMEH